MRTLLFTFIIIALIGQAYGVGTENRYITLEVDNSSGRFFIKTSEGDPDNPNDNKKVLLFDKNPPTSYATIFVNGEGFAIGGVDGYFETYPKLSKNRIISTWRINKFPKIKVIQIIEFVTNVFTLRDDMVKFSYLIVNEDNKPHYVNIRIIFDTTAGENDESPFFVPEYGKIDKETVFYENNMPSFWYSFDRINNPKIKSIGILSGFEEITQPSMLVFASWRKLDKATWHYIPEVGSSFVEGIFASRDTAVGIYFKEVKIAPQEITYYATMYGIFGDSIKTLEKVSFSLSSPSIVSSFPIKLVGTIENKTGFDLRNIFLEISFDTNYFYSSNTSVSFTNLNNNNTISYSWDIFSKENITEGEHELKMNFKYQALQTNIEGYLTRKISVEKDTKKILEVHEMKELGVKQTNILTNYISPNQNIITNIIVTNYQTVFITNLLTLTNTYEYYPSTISKLNYIIEQLNRDLDELITKYFLSLSEEEKELIKKRIEKIKQQIEVEKEKINILLDK